MEGIPPLRYLRKTTLIIAVVFFSFFVHRIYVSLKSDFVEPVVETVSLLSPEQSVVCRNIVDGAPFGVDSIFEENTRLYFHSHLPIEKEGSSIDSVPFKQIWFIGLDTMLVSNCKEQENICVSSIAPNLLRAGEWSVDLVQGRKLWTSRQFKVESKGL
ncbi:MAG TPA: hypothetical protein PLT31_04095 [Fibrobacteraceae bacterium]|nr:hypothetical protein [Fibrobacter sp.]HOG68251.1 hypothetical protein [Fibrobacteraceae bacterium]HPW94351.1 hypothetical protein [Fibrobacteraceae bacterium]